MHIHPKITTPKELRELEHAVAYLQRHFLTEGIALIGGHVYRITLSGGLRVQALG